MFTLSLPWPDTYLLLSPPWPHLPALVRWPLLAGLVAIPLVLLLWLYRYEMKLVRRFTAVCLLSLRLLVLALILALVCLQPVYARDVRYELPGRVLVAVDRSGSMELADPQRAMADKLRLIRALKMLPSDIPSSLVEQWITEVADRREPTLLLPTEAKSEAKSAARWKQFSDAVAKANALTRSDTIRRILAEDGLALLSTIGKRHAVDLLAVDREVREFTPEQLDAVLGPAGDPTYTDLAAPLSRAQRHGRGEVIGVVLLTDGQHNSGPAPGKLARNLGERGVPVFPVVLGDRSSPPDAAVIEVRGPSHNFYKGVEGIIEARVKIAGLPAGDYPVELREEDGKGELTPPKTIAHDGNDQVYDLRFPVKMDAVGQRTLTAVVTPPEGVKDSLPGNNRLATTISVADDRVKVLLADGTARWEYHYLATMLDRDRLLDMTKLVFDQPRLEATLTPEQETTLGLPGREWPKDEEALSAFGCVILGDIDAERLTLAQRLRLERFVSETGGTLIVVAGKNAMPLAFPAATPGGEVDPLRKLLPIESPHELRPVEGFALTLTRAGREARFMELEADRTENDTLWAGFPRPWGWAVAGTAKPGATVLAGWLDPRDEKLSVTDRERKNAVVVRHNYGFGRVLYVGLDSTWRWRFRVGDLYHHRFWGQLIRWAAADKPLAVGNEWVRFGTPQPVYRPGEVVDLTARIAEKTGALKPDLLAGARVIALPTKDGDPERPVALVPLTRPEGRPRVLEGKLRDLPPGRYAVELAIPDLADKLLADGKPLRTTFTVAPPESKEMLRLEANLPLLEDVAVSSGGRVFTPADVEGLRDLLAVKSRPEVERVPTKLYQWWGMLALVVALLTVEWVTRKTAGLP